MMAVDCFVSYLLDGKCSKDSKVTTSFTTATAVATTSLMGSECSWGAEVTTIIIDDVLAARTACAARQDAAPGAGAAVVAASGARNSHTDAWNTEINDAESKLVDVVLP